MPLHEIHWEITNRCNLRCKTCLPMSGQPRNNELTTEEAVGALEKFRAAGATMVHFTGGEPFSRRDFLILLERATSLGMRSAVITNATLLPPATLMAVKALGVELGISLDGANEATNDNIRGQGSFRRVVEALKQCREEEIPTTLFVTVTAVNVDQLDALAELAKEYGCRGIHFNEVTIAGRALGFSDKLALSTEQRKRLPTVVANITAKVFGENISTTDQRCWVDSTTLYSSSNGDLFVCSEVFQRRPDLAIGNIRSFPLETWLESKAQAYNQHKSGCCYGVFASEHVVFVGNIGPNCAFAPRRQIIETLGQLYETLGSLYQDIALDCRNCQDPDCMGYIWLLKQEANFLYNKGVTLVQVNNGPTFIHSFPANSQGKPDLSTKYPACSQLCVNRRECSIYTDRPLVCRLYPIGLETKLDGTIVWALHRDCLHVRRMEELNTLSAFEARARDIIEKLSPELLREIIDTYRSVDQISAFPDGENNYSILKEVQHVEM